MTTDQLTFIIGALAVLCTALVVGLVVVCVLLCEQVGARRSAERRASFLRNQLAAANRRIRKQLKLDDPAPALPRSVLPDATQELPRAPHAPTYKPGNALAVSPQRDVVRSR